MPSASPLRVIPSHKNLLPGKEHFLTDVTPVTSPRDADAFIGWGLRAYGRIAKYRASCRRLPYIAMEDGFLRSVGLGKAGAAPVSLILDRTGVYYDARSPSDVELLLNRPPEPQDCARGAEFITQLRGARLSKYNLDDAPPPHDMHSGRHVLLIDQTDGDASLRFGTETPKDAFADMLRFATEHFPDATLWIKAHPDVMRHYSKSGIKQALRSFPGLPVRWLTTPVSISALAELCEHVLTVTSQAGLEALIAGADVHCFGRPFYAGWGLTYDHGPDAGGASARRRKDVTLDALVYAALIAYPRYADPFTGARVEAEDAADILCYIRDRYRERPRPLHCVGFSGWKYAYTQRCIGTPHAPITFYRNVRNAIKGAQTDDGALAVWSSKEKGALAEALAARPADMPLYRVEDGFLRSAGLGAALLPACSLSLDSSGIYYDGSQPSDMEYLLNTAELSPEQKATGKYLADEIVARNISKYQHSNDGNVFTPPPESKKNVHVVIGQVEDDASVLSSPPESIRNNTALLRQVRERFPDGFLIYRPHPDVTAGYRKGTVDAAVLSETGAIDARDYALSGLLRAADHIHTISSLAGFEGLCYGKRVHTYGAPFYAGWGLTRDRVYFPRRTRMRSPEELIYITLEAYPLYADPVSGYPCGADIILDRLSDRALMARIEKPAFSDRSRILRYIKGMRAFSD